MRTGRPKAELVVTKAEREALERWARRPKTAQALARRARIVLECATGAPNRVVATRFRVTEQMVGKWRARFVGRRLDGLLDSAGSVVPTSTGMDFPSGFNSHPLNEITLDIGVDILFRRIQFKLSFLMKCLYFP